MSTFLLEIATPDRLLLHEQVTEAQIPAAEGYLGILPGHAPLLGELGTGELTLTYVADGRRRSMAISGGWVEVQPDHVRVLATRAEKADEIDATRAQAALKRAQDRLANPSPEIDVARALNALKRAQARLQCASHK
jgi:F-type H+-transporting ATPase subunit epsilon